MKKLVAACLPLVLIVVFMIVGVSVGESESLAGMVAGSPTATASAQQDDGCGEYEEDNLPGTLSTVKWTDDVSKRAEILARLMAGDKATWKNNGFDEPVMFGIKLTTEQIAGILGNLKQESGWIPNNHEGGVKKDTSNAEEKARIHVPEGIGIAQWTTWNRKENLIKFADEHDKHWYNPALQVGFLFHELDTSYRSSTLEPLQKARSVKEATRVFLANFEGPGQPHETREQAVEREMKTRFPNATDVYQQLVKLNIKGGQDSPDMSQCTSTGSVEAGTLGDFKYPNSPIPPGKQLVITNADHFSQYGWNRSGTFDAKLLSGSTGNWSSDNGYAWPQCTLWTAVRLLSLGLSQKLVAKGVPWGTLKKLGGGASQADTLAKFGVKVDNVPHVHDVVSFPPGVLGSDPVWGHVGVVEQVSADRKTFTISEGNSTGHAGDIDVKPIAVDLRLKFAHVEEFVKG